MSVRRRIFSDIKPRFAKIVGWGKCIPPALLTNADLATLLDTSDDWIFKRTGIRSRPISHVPVSELGYVAAANALACAGLQPSEVQLVVLGSCTADEQMPNTASRIQRWLGATSAAAVDVNTACTSFMYALSYASALVRCGTIQNAVVIGADALSSFLDWTDRRPSVVFGDGAGAFVVQASDQESGLRAEVLGCSVESRDVLRIKGIGSAYANAGVSYGTTRWDFAGAEVFRQAVHNMVRSSAEVLKRAGCTIEDIDLAIPHQANLRIIESVARKLRVPLSKVFTDLEHRGNLSSASIPIAFADAIERGRLKPHHRVLVPAFGGGMTWSAHLLDWSERVSPINKQQVSLRACDKTGLEIVAELMGKKDNSFPQGLPDSLYSFPCAAVHARQNQKVRQGSVYSDEAHSAVHTARTLELQPDQSLPS